MERNLGAAWEFKGCRPITRVLCEEEAGRRGKEEELTTLRRRRREKPSAQVSKSRGRESQREQGPQRLGVSAGSRTGSEGSKPGEEGWQPREGRAEPRRTADSLASSRQRTKQYCAR